MVYTNQIHLMSELRKLPTNMTVTWHSGTKSFAEIYSNPLHTGKQRVDDWKEAPPGQQLSEEVMRLLFYKAIDLANQWPDRHVGYVRYDIEGTAETENNRPFIMETSPRYFPGAEEKTIQYEGYVYKSKL